MNIKKNTFLKITLSFLFISAITFTYAQSVLNVGNFDASTSLFEGSIDQKSPIVFCYKYSVTQQIYTSAELEKIKQKKITDIEFRSRLNADFSYTEYVHNVKIYLKEVINENFTKNSENKFTWTTVSEKDLYYDKALKMNFDEITEYSENVDHKIKFTLNKPFKYNGKNLMIMIVQNAPDGITNDIYNDFYCFPSNVKNKPYRTLYHANDKSTFDTPYPIATNPALKQIPVINITYRDTSLEINEKRDLKEHVFKSHNSVEFRKIKELELFNSLGKKIRKIRVTDSSYTMSINTHGVYIVKILTEDGRYIVDKILL